MRYERIELDSDGAFLEVYAADPVGDYVRGALLVIPGGGYGMVCSDREGEPIAMAFMPHGYQAFVLHYSVGKKPFPSHLIQASRAMKYIRDHAEVYRLDPERIFAVGFSAGGHLAATLGTMWDKKEIYDAVPMPFGYNKPSGMMLIYPVISARLHGASFRKLLMEENPSDERLESCSIENAVSERTCPAFILHTSNDQIVHVKNSLVLADALSTHGIKFEMHIYPDAPHGIALGNEITKCGVEKWCNPSVAEWVKNAAAWASSL